MADSQDTATGSAPSGKQQVQDVALLQTMLSILLEEKAEQAAERKEKKRLLEQRQASHKSLSTYNEKELKDAQRICTHLKGGKLKSARLDYAVAHHTFPDTSTYIRCLICRMKWKKNDTREFLIRRGKKVENHTGLGWLDAVQMLRSSTNTPTASEAVSQVKYVAESAEEFKNPLAVEI